MLARLGRSPRAVAALAVIAISLLVLVVRGAGVLESLELNAYDWYIRLRPVAPAADPRVFIVTATEDDIQKLGSWPLPDGVLARAIDQLGRLGPRAIGLDIYRDVPVPPGTDELAAVLRRESRVIVVTKFGEGPSAGVPPPAVLKGSDRVAFNDVLVDSGGTVRRGLLFLDDGTSVIPSFALRLAQLYLEAKGITPQPDPDDASLLRLGKTTIRPLEPNDGGYVRADTRGYQFLLDFAERGRFDSAPLSVLLEGRLPPEAVRDKVVLLGVMAESVKDDFYTPYSRGQTAGQQLPGVALHGAIVGQLMRMALEGDLPTAVVGDRWEALWVVVWAALGGLIGLRVQSWRFPLAAGSALAALGLADLGVFMAGWWLPLVPPVISCAAAASVVTAYVSFQETVQRRMLMQLFSRHVSREVAESIWKQREDFLDGGRPRSQRMIITVLFTDLTGFTTVSEKHPPEVLLEWLNDYMDAMTQVVSQHGGVIRQYAGDSIVAVFGAPVARTTDAEIAADAINAVECALAMETTLKALNRRWREQGRPPTGMRVGIYTGPVVAGTLGSAQRSEYVTVGDTMNTASRLESYDKQLFAPDSDENPIRILIGEPTRQYLGGAFEAERVGDVSLKGKEHTVAVYRVTGRVKQEASLQATPAGRTGS